MRYYLTPYQRNNMGITLLLSRVFQTRASSDEAHKIKNQIAHESMKTAHKMDKANKVLQENITITHNIAKAMGILKGST